MKQRPHNMRARAALLLLIASVILCAMGAYLAVQRVIPLPYLTIGDLLRLVLYSAVFLWGILVIYGASTLPAERIARFTRFRTAFEEPFARAAFTILGLTMVVLSLLSMNSVFNGP